MTLDRIFDKTRKANRRKLRVRKKTRGCAERPRLTVYRSSRHIYAQIVDDDAGRSLVAQSTRSKDFQATGMDQGGNVKAASEVGRLVAEKAKELGISKVIFDRGSFLYHGRVKALADGARKGGLEL
jgi:large subunit ribosomal protein L18